MGDLFSKEQPTTSQLDESTAPEQRQVRRRDNTLSNFENDILMYHNMTRRNAGLPELTWEPSYAKRAREWNEFLKNNEECEMRHPLESEQENERYLPGNLGQNLYIGHGYPDKPKNTPKLAVSGWYNECKDYNKPPPGQEIPDNFSNVGHFTQLQWKDTTKVGCHEIQCPKEMTTSDGRNVPAQGSLITCNYDKGNIGGEFRDQVVYKSCPLTL